MTVIKHTIFKSLSVSDLTRYLRQLLEYDEILTDLWVQGEVSNVSKPASGHIYFTLKDAGASLKCVVWRSKVKNIAVSLQNGMAVEVHGSIAVYEAGGQYQLKTDIIRHRGEGDLFLEYLRLKSKLEQEGLFDLEQKKPIPEEINTIGIVTSLTGAALQDMIDTIKRRNPMKEILIAGASVQGDSAPDELVSALKKLEDNNSVDIILLARGGGSLEDLWSFNNERVVREIYRNRIPIITGIGHESDFTLSDFAADLRAPTPTAAAELATSVTLSNLRDQVKYLDDSIDELIEGFINSSRDKLQSEQIKLMNNSPSRLIQSYWQGLDGVSIRLNRIQRNRLRLEQIRLENIRERIAALNPDEVLKRGYAIITKKHDSQIVGSVKKINLGDELIVKVQDGKFNVNVNSMENL
ncbi:exodeoxyribonuclease VII large subunit [Chloroflexota bacterium]